MPEAEYFEELPVALRGEIVLALAEGALAQSYMFRQLSHEVRRGWSVWGSKPFERTGLATMCMRVHVCAACGAKMQERSPAASLDWLDDAAHTSAVMLFSYDEQAKAQLAAGAVPVRLVSGHNLYSEGDDADSFYMLQEGECASRHGVVAGCWRAARLACQEIAWKEVLSKALCCPPSVLL